MSKLTDASVREQIAALVFEREMAFARTLDRLFAGFNEQVQHDQAWRTFRRLLLETFTAQLVRVGPLADPVLLQLVREAYEHFESPESRVDIRDWVKTARPFVIGERADDVIDPRD